MKTWATRLSGWTVGDGSAYAALIPGLSGAAADKPIKIGLIDIYSGQGRPLANRP